ncbi:MAG: YfhO family protein, partial [Gemmatimonadetes bacterium]|nr:YfhO family protein [Gemmatimonadota bacterium]
AFGFVMPAVNFLPFQDYVDKSPRGMTGGRGYEYSTSFSMPPRAVLGLAVPEQVGANVQNERGEYVLPVYRGENAFRLHTEYVGALVMVLLALGAYYSRRNRYWWFFAGLGLFALTLALGGNTPLYLLYYNVLPGLKRFRAPDLAYYVLGFSLICMAAITLERLAELRASRAERRPAAAAADDAGVVLWIGAGVVGAAVLGAMFLGSGAAQMAEGTSGLTPSQGWMRFALFAAAVAGTVWAWWERKLPSVAAMALLSLITVADLWMVGKKFFQTMDAPEVAYAPDDVTSFLMQQPRPVRYWPVPRQSAWPRFINQPMWFGLENAAGEHGNQLQSYNEFAGAGTQTYVDFHNFNDPRFLAAANVRSLVISAEVQVPWLREVFRGEQAIVYENTLALPRAYLAERVITTANPRASLGFMQDSTWNPRTTAVVDSPRNLELSSGPLRGEARVVAHGPDRVVVRTTASRPAYLVLSDNWYEDWRAAVDGRETPIYRTNHTFRGLVVPAGTHTVEFTFRPAALYTGFYIHLASLAVLAVYGAVLLVRARRRPAGTHGAAPDPAPA